MEISIKILGIIISLIFLCFLISEIYCLATGVKYRYHYIPLNFIMLPFIAILNVIVLIVYYKQFSEISLISILPFFGIGLIYIVLYNFTRDRVLCRFLLSGALLISIIINSIVFKELIFGKQISF